MSRYGTRFSLAQTIVDWQHTEMVELLFGNLLGELFLKAPKGLRFHTAAQGAADSTHSAIPLPRKMPWI